MQYTHPFFGFGANASPVLMRALLGRIPKSRRAVLPHYRLYIQPWKALSVDARKVLSQYWSPLFKSYVIRPKRGEATAGIVWDVTSEELAYLTSWDLDDGRWTERSTVVCTIQDQEEIIAETNVLPDWNDNLVVARPLKRFLNPRAKMITLAHHLHTTLTAPY